MNEETIGCLLAVRVRGTAGRRHQVEAVLQDLGLKRRNQAVLLPNNPATRGALEKVKDTIFWGDATEQLLTLLLSSRPAGSHKLTDAEAKKRFGVDNIQALARLLSTGELKPRELRSKGLSNHFSLNSPRGGFRGTIKNPSGRGGILGFSKEPFQETIKRMI